MVVAIGCAIACPNLVATTTPRASLLGMRTLKLLILENGDGSFRLQTVPQPGGKAGRAALKLAKMRGEVIDFAYPKDGANE